MSLSIRTYKKDECVTFKSTKGKYGALSNMAPGFPIKIGAYTLRNVEALYQALRFPDYPEIQNKICSYPSPISAKKYSRTHIDKTRFDWNTHRFKIMKFCLELKYAQNKELFYQALLTTKNFPIVEYTDKDKVWGASDEGEYYVGTNALGRLLMELRENIKNDTFELIIPDINNFKIFGDKITLELINTQFNN